MSEPAEGWYADPTGAAQLRWWDGHAWTEYVEPYEAAPPQAGAAPTQAEAIPAYDEAPHYAQPEHVASTAAAEANAEFPPIPSPDNPAHWEASDPIPSPEETGAWEPAHASSMNEADDAPIPMPGDAETPQETLRHPQVDARLRRLLGTCRGFHHGPRGRMVPPGRQWPHSR